MHALNDLVKLGMYLPGCQWYRAASHFRSTEELLLALKYS